MDEFSPATIAVIVSILTQVVLITAVIQNNRNTVGHLKEQTKDLKEWLKDLQKTVNDLRAKIGH